MAAFRRFSQPVGGLYSVGVCAHAVLHAAAELEGCFGMTGLRRLLEQGKRGCVVRRHGCQELLCLLEDGVGVFCFCHGRCLVGFFILTEGC